MELVTRLHEVEGGGGYPIGTLCRLLGVATSSYYRRTGQGNSPRAQANQVLLGELRGHFVASHETYGARRLTAALRAHGQMVNHKRVERLMRMGEMMPHPTRRYRAVAKRPSGRRTAPNRLQQHFVAAAPNQVWLVDTTEFATHEGPLYLAVVEDLFSRRVVGWDTGARFTQELVCEALRRALALRRCARQQLSGLLHHSDRGAQYTSDLYLALLAEAGLQPSMSAAGNCYDNAPMESFMGTLKVEWTHPFTYSSHSQLHQDLFDYIEGFYNTHRLHSALGYLSPSAFELRFQQQQHSLVQPVSPLDR